MSPHNRITAAIQGSGKTPPVVIPYLDYYFPLVVDQVTPFSLEDLEDGELAVKADALCSLHDYFDCDWARLTTDPPMYGSLAKERPYRRGARLLSAEQLLESGRYELARVLVERLGDDKFVYGRVRVPYGALFGDFSDMSNAMIALKREPERVLQIIEGIMPQILEEIKAWADTGVHSLWLGQWLCSADMISEADYLKFVYPYDQALIEAVKAAGMIPIYHFCGDAVPRLPHIVKSQPTIFGVEESKKGFDVEIGKIRAGMGKEVCLLGNVDVYDVVELGTPEAWAQEVERQVRAAGPERFIVSCGSPITPDTPPEQLLAFIQTAKQVCDSFSE